MNSRVADQAGVWLIGDLRLDPETRRVTRANDELNLTKLSYRMLLVLAESHPALLGHDELIDRVWPGRLITPETLSQRVHLLRQALGDSGSTPQYIGVVRGEGYRLLVPVRRETRPDDSVASTQAEASVQTAPVAPHATWLQQRWSALTAMMIVAALLLWVSLANREPGDDLPQPRTSPNAVAVLPLITESENPDDLILAQGLADELRDQLGRVPGLQLVARSSAVAVNMESFDPIQVAKRLRARKLITGNLHRDPTELRIAIQMIDGVSGYEIWSKSYRRSSRELLAIQQQVGIDVVNQLLPDFSAMENLTNASTLNVSANELMLLARHYELEVRERPELDQALLSKSIELYEQTVATDPTWALAHTRLGRALLYAGKVDEAREPILKAVALSPNLSEVQTVLGDYYWLRRLPGSKPAWQRALELNSNNADAMRSLAFWYWHQGEVESTYALYRKALELDPLSLSRHADLGNFTGVVGFKAPTLEIAARVLQMFPSADGHALAARLHELAGEVDTGILLTMEAAELSDDPAFDWHRAEMYASLGENEVARQIDPNPGLGLLYLLRDYPALIAVAEAVNRINPDEIMPKYLLAFAYNVSGRFADSIRLLHSAGLPESALSDTRRARDVEALMTLIDALYGTGAQSEADELAEWIIEFTQNHMHNGALDWWPVGYGSCALAARGLHAAAEELLTKLATSPRLPWVPLLRDAPCFDALQGRESYESVMNDIETERKKLRERLALRLVNEAPTVGLN